MKKRVVFIDRDGTIIVEPAETKQVDRLDLLEFLPGAIGGLTMLARDTSYELVMVTNQDGLGTASFPEESFWPAHNAMLKTLAGEGVRFDNICIDRSFEHENLPTRKPGTGMLQQYLSGEYDLAGSFVVGDRATDLELARRLGGSGIFYGSENHSESVLSTTSWFELAQFLIARERSAKVERTTKETSIRIELGLYGSGRVRISTGIGFFDHMLDLFGHHAGFDLDIDAKGDLHVDEHHLVEDVGIALGEAIARALGGKQGIERYGFLLPMDESLATVALDLSGRSQLEWHAQFHREKVGDLPTEMFPHFFKSLADAVKCSLHIQVTGENEHHKIEAIFKGVARAFRIALKRDPFRRGIPSTKGVL